MKTFKEFIIEATGIQKSDVHSDLAKIGKHTDQGGGYHLYKPDPKHSVDSIAKTLVKHGFTRQTHYRSGGPNSRMPADVHSYSRTPGPYHTESVHIDHKDGKPTWIKRSLQRG